MDNLSGNSERPKTWVDWFIEGMMEVLEATRPIFEGYFEKEKKKRAYS